MKTYMETKKSATGTLLILLLHIIYRKPSAVLHPAFG